MHKLLLITLTGIILLSVFVSGCADSETKETLETPTATQPSVAPPIITPTPTPSEPILENPTWEQLLDFLKADNTDARLYLPSWSNPTNAFECYDFAETLQKHANIAGWRCAIVTIHLIGDQEIYDPNTHKVVNLRNLPWATHALNAFQTTDRGLVYIDDTGADELTKIFYSGNFDKIVDVQLGKKYIPEALFPKEPMPPYLSVGIIDSITFKWDK